MSDIQFVDPQVVPNPYQEVDVAGMTVIVPQSHFIVGGEYKDEPDLVIEVRHAVNPDGLDISASVAQRISDLLKGA